MWIAAYGFLIFERETILPSSPRRTTLFQTPVIPYASDERRLV